MPLQSESSSLTGIRDTDGVESTGTGRLHRDTAPLVNRLGDDRPAWLAALNLTAARHFLESDPPRLAGSRVSLLRLVTSLERDRVESDIIVAPSLRSDSAMRPDLELLAVAQRAAAIAAELGQMIERGAHGAAAGPSDFHTGLSAVRYSIQDLDRAIAVMLGDRCQGASLSSDR
ncbi:hypothetical protein EWE75_13695 [Sphingomonas populi]|uniref:Uncharacterized protein n=1 Tax=Sphingomonas populi TaxID=2484750 RepID=A0A4Q6XU91_9SPHN|nr:hypothetical protein [Sphingomonas populi]RZF63850.1 hypothetical protein EWE75_13695 [Sphingomonas populi]